MTKFKPTSPNDFHGIQRDIVHALSCFERNADATIQMDAPMKSSVLFIARVMNWSAHSESDWLDSTWIVFRDGTVYYQQSPDNEPSLRTYGIIIDALDTCGIRYDNRTIKRIIHDLYFAASHTPAAMREGDFQQLLAILNGPFKTVKAHSNALDGDGWRMVYYDRYPIHSIDGYIYGVEPLERIQDILTRNVNFVRIQDIARALESQQPERP